MCEMLGETSITRSMYTARCRNSGSAISSPFKKECTEPHLEQNGSDGIGQPHSGADVTVRKPLVRLLESDIRTDNDKSGYVLQGVQWERFHLREPATVLKEGTAVADTAGQRASRQERRDN